MNLKPLGKLLSAAVLSLSIAGSALADIVTFDIQWSGLAFGYQAIATGFITFDNAQLPDVGTELQHSLPSPAVSDLQVTINSAAAGNGTFGLSDFSSFYFWTPSALDLTRELIGQSLANGCTYGTSTGSCGNGYGGDFNLFGASALAPTGTYYFQLITPGEEHLLVTSIAPRMAVPEPATVALLGAGLFGFAVLRRKSPKNKNA